MYLVILSYDNFKPNVFAYKKKQTALKIATDFHESRRKHNAFTDLENYGVSVYKIETKNHTTNVLPQYITDWIKL